MIHTEQDALAFTYLMLVVLGTGLGGASAIAVLIALLLKAFRSRAAMYIWFVLSAIGSIPFVLLCALIIGSGGSVGPGMVLLPDPLDDWPVLEWVSAEFVMLLPAAVLLCFVWAAPTVQYRSLRRKTPGSTGAGADQLLNPTGNGPAS